MTIGELLNEWEALQAGKKEILSSKNNDYASSQDAFSNFKFISLVSGIPVEKTFLQFIAVKLARLMELMNKDKEVKNESIDDTLIDMANYVELLYLYRKDYAKNANSTNG